MIIRVAQVANAANKTNRARIIPTEIAEAAKTSPKITSRIRGKNMIKNTSLKNMIKTTTPKITIKITTPKSITVKIMGKIIKRSITKDRETVRNTLTKITIEIIDVTIKVGKIIIGNTSETIIIRITSTSMVMTIRKITIRIIRKIIKTTTKIITIKTNIRIIIARISTETLIKINIRRKILLNAITIDLM